MKISADFDPEKLAIEKKMHHKRDFRSNFFAKTGMVFFWYTWFFISFYGAKLTINLVAILISRIFDFDLKNLPYSVNAMIEASLYLLIIAFFVLIPIKFLPKIQTFFLGKKTQKITDKSAEKNKNNLKDFLNQIGFSRPPQFSDLGQWIYFVPIFYVTFIVVSIIMMGFIGVDKMSQEQSLNYATSGNSNIDLIIIFIALVIVAPIAEEILLRGYLFTKIRKKFSFFITAIIVSLLFALAHGQLNVGIMTFILSMYASRIRENSGAIYGAILLHATVNSIAFAVRFLDLFSGLNM